MVIIVDKGVGIILSVNNIKIYSVIVIEWWIMFIVF